MEIKKVKVNLDYKTKRTGDITRMFVLQYDKEEFDIIEWAKRNNSFGPNYLIRNSVVYEILPPSYRPDFKGTPDDAIVIAVINGTSSDKALENLKEYLRPKITKLKDDKAPMGKNKKDNEPVKAHSVRSTDKGKPNS